MFLDDATPEVGLFLISLQNHLRKALCFFVIVLKSQTLSHHKYILVD
jgi:hypothetical protein